MSNIATVTFAVDATVKCGKSSYKPDAAIKHAAAVYDKLWLLQEEQLTCYREIGEILIGLQALFAGNTKAFGSYIEKSELAQMSRQDRSDAMFLATNWTKVQKLNKDGSLDTLGVSAIRKRLKASEGKATGAGVRGADKAKAKGSAEGKDQVVAPKEPKVQTEEELADLVIKMLADNGLDYIKFAKALGAKRKGS